MVNVSFYNRISKALASQKQKDREGYIDRGRNFLKPYEGHPNLNVIKEPNYITPYLPFVNEKINRRRKLAGADVTGSAAGTGGTGGASRFNKNK